MPAIGGIAMGLSFILAYFAISLFYRDFQETRRIVIPSIIMLVFGAIDDWKELSILAKLSVQIIATALLVIFGIKTQIVHIGNVANIIITFIWVLGISNAFNHLDVIDGLAAGCAVIISLAFFIICLLNGDIKNAILILALSSAILSFLIYNLPPAKIYMGNSGSHFLGFVLAAIALAISYAPLERKIALFSPVLILGFPILDTLFLIFMRTKRGISALQKSDDHLALRFIKLGYSKNKTLFLMLIIAFLFSSCGIIISRASNSIGLIIIAFVISLSTVLTIKMSKVSV